MIGCLCICVGFCVFLIGVVGFFFVFWFMGVLVPGFDWVFWHFYWFLDWVVLCFIHVFVLGSRGWFCFCYLLIEEVLFVFRVLKKMLMDPKAFGPSYSFFVGYAPYADGRSVSNEEWWSSQ